MTSLNRRTFLLLGTGATLGVVLGGCDQLSYLAPTAGELEGLHGVPTEAAPDLVSHVISRLSFGARPGEYARVRGLGEDDSRRKENTVATRATQEGGVPGESAAEAYIREQLSPDSITDAGGFWASQKFESLDEPLGEHYEYDEKELLRELVGATILRAAQSKRQLFEVMVQFWSDHFNIDPSKADCRWLKSSDDRDVIRTHALGKFPELLRASALSPAMLWYLDGRANRKGSADEKPNENYARELMELHTLGVRGGYTQTDVMEVARCLTGWTAHPLEWFKTGKVEFVPSLHDDGEKTVLGERLASGGGASDLDRVLNIVALHPSTARHLATKLCTRFISDDPPEAAIVATAKGFRESRGDIRETLRALFATPEFRNVRANKFKLPFHFVVSALRGTAAKSDAGAPLIEFLSRMGHIPFHYPTPDGYPQEPYPWMGTLLWRWNFAAALVGNRIAGTSIDAGALLKVHGGEQPLAAHLFGRVPREDELTAAHLSKAPLALLLASPAFQTF